jgi:beta-1,4-mannosyltransferase
VLHDRPPAHFHRTSATEAHELFLRLIPNLTDQASLRGFLPSSTAPYFTPFTQIASTDENAALTTPRANSPPEAAFVNPLTTHSLSSPKYRPDRPALLVSSTSWTPDEDFSILLAALDGYEKAARERDRQALEGTLKVKLLPKLLVIVTGRGPQQKEYLARIASLHRGADVHGKIDEGRAWRWVRVISAWLSAEDYPLLLGNSCTFFSSRY